MSDDTLNVRKHALDLAIKSYGYGAASEPERVVKSAELFEAYLLRAEKGEPVLTIKQTGRIVGAMSPGSREWLEHHGSPSKGTNGDFPG